MQQYQTLSSLNTLESSNGTLYVESMPPEDGYLHVESHCHGSMGIRAISVTYQIAFF